MAITNLRAVQVRLFFTMTLSSLTRILTAFQQGRSHSNLCLDASYVFNAISRDQSVGCPGLSLQQ